MAVNNKIIDQEKSVSLLKEISNIPKARKEIEGLITYMAQKSFTQSIQQEKAEFSKLILNSIIKISDKYNLSRIGIALYLKLDRDIYFKYNIDMPGMDLYGISTSDFVSNRTPVRQYISGSNLEDVYTYNMEGGINFLHTNVDLFPSSAKKYIKVKKRKYNAKPVIKALKNSFQAKTWATSLPEDFKITYFRNSLSFFKKNNTNLERLISFGYIYETVISKYPDNEKAKKFITEIESRIVSDIEIMFSEFEEIGTRYIASKANQWKAISKMLSECSNLLNKVIHNEVYICRSQICILLESIAKKEEDINDLIEQQKAFLVNFFGSQYFDLDSCPKSEVDNILYSYKIQFLKHLEVDSNFLKKNS